MAGTKSNAGMTYVGDAFRGPSSIGGGFGDHRLGGGFEFGFAGHVSAPSSSSFHTSMLQPGFNLGSTPAPPGASAIFVGRSAGKDLSDGLARFIAPVNAQPLSLSKMPMPLVAKWPSSTSAGVTPPLSFSGLLHVPALSAVPPANPFQSSFTLGVQSVVGSGFGDGAGACVAGGGSVPLGTTAKQVGQGSGLAERQLRLHGGLGWMRTALASALQPFRSCMAPAPLPAAAEASPLPQQMGLAAAGAVEPSANRP